MTLHCILQLSQNISINPDLIPKISFQPFINQNPSSRVLAQHPYLLTRKRVPGSIRPTSTPLSSYISAQSLFIPFTGLKGTRIVRKDSVMYHVPFVRNKIVTLISLYSAFMKDLESTVLCGPLYYYVSCVDTLLRC